MSELNVEKCPRCAGQVYYAENGEGKLQGFNVKPDEVLIVKTEGEGEEAKTTHEVVRAYAPHAQVCVPPAAAAPAAAPATKAAPAIQKSVSSKPTRQENRPRVNEPNIQTAARRGKGRRGQTASPVEKSHR